MPTPLHQRQQIRTAVTAALVAGVGSVSSRVFETRMAPLPQTKLPAVSVYDDEESVTSESRATAPRELDRTVLVSVVAWIALTEPASVEAALDAVSLEIERSMHADPTFGGVASNSVLSTTSKGLKVDGDRPMGAVELVYSVRYFTQAPEAADVTLVDFETAKIDYSLAGEQTDSRDQAHDELDDLET